jgi:hypothetical protein
MTRQNHEGVCDRCGRTFAYHLIHNGFNESCYGYCSACGMTALIDTLYRDRTADGFPRHRAITPGAERFLAPCSCGGSFLSGAGPRCPHCNEVLSANAAASWIESAAPGTKKGWRWQRDWEDLYAIIIEQRYVKNPWSNSAANGPAA